MRKSEQTKARERVLHALPHLSDADLWYIIGACNGLIQARRQASEQVRNEKPNAMVDAHEEPHAESH